MRREGGWMDGYRGQLRIHSSKFCPHHSSACIGSSQEPGQFLFSQRAAPGASQPAPALALASCTHLGEGLFQRDDVGETVLSSHQPGAHVEMMLLHRQGKGALGSTLRVSQLGQKKSKSDLLIQVSDGTLRKVLAPRCKQALPPKAPGPKDAQLPGWDQL